jgi:hypothetical protein
LRIAETKRFTRSLGRRHTRRQTKNFTNGFRGASQHLVITELHAHRSNTLNYAVTIDDPETWTRPWTFMIPLKHTDERIYGTCHGQLEALPAYGRRASGRRKYVSEIGMPNTKRAPKVVLATLARMAIFIRCSRTAAGIVNVLKAGAKIRCAKQSRPVESSQRQLMS